MIFSLKPRGTEPLISESNSSAELSSKPKPTSIRKMSGNESNKAKATPNSPHSLQFVNISANGTSEEERHRHQRMVRSAAMKSFRREQKSKQDGKKGKSGSRSSTATPSDTDPSKASIRRVTFPDIPPVSSAEQTESSSPSDGVVSERSWPTGVSPVFGELDINSVDLSMHPHTEQSTALVVPQSSPTFSYLGAGRGDPFQLYTENAGSHAGELIDHSLSILWPGFRPRTSHVNGARLASAWHQKVRERPVVMHALLFGAIVHMDILRSPHIELDNPTRLHHKVQTLQLLRAELDKPSQSQTPLEDLILAVLSLGTNEIETMHNNKKAKPSSPFNPPLPSVQWLDVYGSIVHVKEHTIALRKLVSRNGGLEAMKLEGLAEVLSFADILGASQKLTKPHWPLLQRTIDQASIIPSPTTPTLSRYQLQYLGQGFQPLLSEALTPDALEVLRAIGGLTITIDGHHRGSNPVQDFGNLIDRRNVVQHRLLSLPRGEELSDGAVRWKWLYEATRWATLIYSAAATFPLPPLAGIFQTLSANLHDSLEGSLSEHQIQDFPKPLLWILTLGGIASFGTPRRAWYVDNLRVVAEQFEFEDWDDVVAELRHFLWLDCACEQGGRRLWCEVASY